MGTPRNVRNFWVVANVNNQAKKFGPRKIDDGLTMDIYIRDHGQVKLAGAIVCLAADRGRLVIRAEGFKLLGYSVLIEETTR